MNAKAAAINEKMAVGVRVLFIRTDEVFTVVRESEKSWTVTNAEDVELLLNKRSLHNCKIV